MRREILLAIVLISTLVTIMLAGCPARVIVNDDNKEGMFDSKSMLPWSEVSKNIAEGNKNSVTVEFTTYRTPVVGGWLYCTMMHCSHGCSISQTFVPDVTSQAAERLPTP